jgi:hypothetical protein
MRSRATMMRKVEARRQSRSRMRAEIMMMRRRRRGGKPREKEENNTEENNAEKGENNELEEGVTMTTRGKRHNTPRPR